MIVDVAVGVADGSDEADDDVEEVENLAKPSVKLVSTNFNRQNFAVLRDTNEVFYWESSWFQPTAQES